MADRKNFLLGYGERLIEPVKLVSGGGSKDPPYPFETAKSRLLGFARAALQNLNSMQSNLLFNDQAVVTVTLHPEYLAKSYFPSKLFSAAKMVAIGSKPITIKPSARSHGRPPEEMVTSKLYVVARKQEFSDWVADLETWTARHPAAEELAKIEELVVPTAKSKLISLPKKSDEISFEFVLHGFRDAETDSEIQQNFIKYVSSNNRSSSASIKFYTGGLSFAKVITSPKMAAQISEYSFVRAVRVMPTLRPIEEVTRIITKEAIEEPKNVDPISPDITVAIFDGGIADDSPLRKYANAYDAPGVGLPVDKFLDHGEKVTSALLFGAIVSDEGLPRPYVTVDHYRVLDKNTGSDGDDLYSVLGRIKKVLSNRKYTFVSLSIGPALSVEDDDIHPWTAFLDELLDDGAMLLTAAVGNTGGDSPPPANVARIQVPADCVNALAIGAANSQGKSWKRASYSSIGPGRSPGRVKPDMVSFGGTKNEPFLAYGKQGLMGVQGTSFSAPASLRIGVGIRVTIGDVLSPLAIKALLVNTSQQAKLPREEIGWGRIDYDLNSIITCPDDAVRVVYQGHLGGDVNTLRAPIPLPSAGLQGPIYIAATFCFSSPINAAYSDHYTRAGLEILFRPDDEDFADEDSMHPSTDSFFRARDLYLTEDDLRKDAHKWETCLHRKKRKDASLLKNPVFDIRYHERIDGHKGKNEHLVPFALVISLRAPKVPDLYNRVVTRYRNILQVLRPVIELPIRI